MDWMNQTQEMFKTWTDVQKKTWDTWLDGAKHFDVAQPTQMWEKNTGCLARINKKHLKCSS